MPNGFNFTRIVSRSLWPFILNEFCAFAGKNFIIGLKLTYY
nr:MAG TPA: hypothetical protein [Caudoviricetes sp.]